MIDFYSDDHALNKMTRGTLSEDLIARSTLGELYRVILVTITIDPRFLFVAYERGLQNDGEDKETVKLTNERILTFEPIEKGIENEAHERETCFESKEGRLFLSSEFDIFEPTQGDVFEAGLNRIYEGDRIIDNESYSRGLLVEAVKIHGSEDI